MGVVTSARYIINKNLESTTVATNALKTRPNGELVECTVHPTTFNNWLNRWFLLGFDWV